MPVPIALINSLFFISQAWSLELYVDATLGSDSNNGSIAEPVRTIQEALYRATDGSIVNIAPGSYSDGFKIERSGIEIRKWENKESLVHVFEAEDNRHAIWARY